MTEWPKLKRWTFYLLYLLGGIEREIDINEIRKYLKSRKVFTYLSELRPYYVGSGSKRGTYKVYFNEFFRVFLDDLKREAENKVLFDQEEEKKFLETILRSKAFYGSVKLTENISEYDPFYFVLQALYSFLYLNLCFIPPDKRVKFDKKRIGDLYRAFYQAFQSVKYSDLLMLFPPKLFEKDVFEEFINLMEYVANNRDLAESVLRKIELILKKDPTFYITLAFALGLLAGQKLPELVSDVIKGFREQKESKEEEKESK